MSDPVSPTAKAKSVSTNNLAADIITEAQAHPPVQAWSTTGTPAIFGNNPSTGYGVEGLAARGDGVHGESKGSGMSGVAGIHQEGGNGVYGRSSGNAGYFDGNVTVVGKVTVTDDIVLAGADCAEQFECASGLDIAPGSVVTLGENGAIQECEEAYDRRVAGVIAGGGQFRPGIVLDQQISLQRRAAVSLIGKACCKVDAEYGAIAVGDPLTSSPTTGHAMKASDRERAFGAVIGKALKSLDSGKGMIPILLALQ